MRSILLTLSLLSLAGCIPRTAVVHDGLETTVLDAETKKPLPDAFVYDRFENKTGPHVLARSNNFGQLRLEPATRLTFASPLGEALVFQSLWVCKEGYKPVQVGSRSGWNADYQPSEYYRPNSIELMKSALLPAESCSDVKW